MLYLCNICCSSATSVVFLQQPINIGFSEYYYKLIVESQEITFDIIVESQEITFEVIVESQGETNEYI